MEWLRLGEEFEDDRVLPNLEIVNFRTFPQLVVERLGQVNLIVGRNNVGKTTLLEAAWLHAAKFSPDAILQLLIDRGEFTDSQSEAGFEVDIPRLFHRASDPAESLRELSIGPADPEGKFALRTGWVQVVPPREEGLHPDYREVRSSESVRTFDHVLPAITVAQGSPESEFKKRYVRNERTWYLTFRTFQMTRSGNWGNLPAIPLLLRALRFSENQIPVWWDAIAQTDAEDRILEFLGSLTQIKGIASVGSPTAPGGRRFVVRLHGESSPQPLTSLGDGVERMFRIALALEYVNRMASKGSGGERVLFLDEVEWGIHYTAIPDYWRSIFDLAKNYGVQVFATTHSWDCVMGFQQAAAESEAEGVLVRLEAGRGQFRAFTFGEEDLAVVTRDRIEVR